MGKIQSVYAREILDSRGNPTIEVEVKLDKGGFGRVAVPSGASTGAYEAVELRDNDAKRFLGKGVLNAVNNVKEIIAPNIIGKEYHSISEFDNILLDLDGTENKSKLGANAILGVSLAAARAESSQQNLPFYKFVSKNQKFKLPVPLMNVINGGAHANNGMDVQEFMLVPVVGPGFKNSLRAGAEVFQNLKKILNAKGFSTAVGDEGGFAPNLKSNRQALELIMESIEKAGYTPGKDFYLALDVAATELYQDGSYQWEGKRISSSELGDIYSSWKELFPLVSIEDGFSEDDWDGWINYTRLQGKELQLVGDDLFVTNPKRLQMGIEKGAANALLVKVNQIGTLSETMAAVQLAQSAGYRTVMSHRSGETEDSTIADLAVGLGSQQIKTGSLCRSERMAKYNQLLRIEEELGTESIYWSKDGFEKFCK